MEIKNCIKQPPAKGQEVYYMRGYLALIPIPYHTGAKHFWIYLLEKKTVQDFPRIEVRIPNGIYRNSMYFDGQIPKIIDNQRRVLNWTMTGNGKTVYITESTHFVSGIWIDECKMDLVLIGLRKGE